MLTLMLACAFTQTSKFVIHALVMRACSAHIAVLYAHIHMRLQSTNTSNIKQARTLYKRSHSLFTFIVILSCLQLHNMCYLLVNMRIYRVPIVVYIGVAACLRQLRLSVVCVTDTTYCLATMNSVADACASRVIASLLP
jgi:hypothetical protein